MKAVVKTKEGEGAELLDVDYPKLEPDSVIVKVKATSICGTDVHIYEWNDWSKNRIKLPHILGHEFCGDVVEVGSEVTTLKKGDFVTAETHIICGKCFQCKIGEGHICDNVKIIGVDTPGCFAEYVSVPARIALRNPGGVGDDVASVQEPLGNAVHAVFADDRSIAGKTVAIVGAGPIGLLAAAVAKSVGARKVFISDLNDYRLNIAKELGIKHVFNAKAVNPAEEVKKLTYGLGADIVLEMSGSKPGFESAINSVRKGGRISLFGLYDGNIELDINEDVIFKGVKFFGITGRKIFETWETVRTLLSMDHLDIKPIITHTLPLEDFAKGMELMKKGMCGKIVLKP